MERLLFTQCEVFTLNAPTQSRYDDGGVTTLDRIQGRFRTRPRHFAADTLDTYPAGIGGQGDKPRPVVFLTHTNPAPPLRGRDSLHPGPWYNRDGGPPLRR